MSLLQITGLGAALGASAVKCCYAASGNRMAGEVAGVGDLVNTSASLHDNKGISVDAKISLNVRHRVGRPACIAGVRISRRRMKL